MKKLVITFIFIMCGALLPGMTVFADPEDDTEEVSSDSDLQYIDYTGPLDIYTGDPVQSETSSSEEVRIGDGVSFNSFSRRFIYKAGKARILCSVADGMVVTEGVVLSKDGECNLAVYKDGEPMEEIPSEITEEGTYVVVTWTNSTETQLLTFRIVNDITGKLTRYVLPTGFTVKSVTVDGTPVAHGAGTVEMMQEGNYVINYVCAATGAEYKLELEVDHTPPDILFIGLDDNDEARGPVTIAGMKEGDRISIVFEDEVVGMDEEYKVSETGDYHVVVTDIAGNTIEKDFRILLYLNFNAVLFILAVILLIQGIAIALIVTRKKLRVR